MAERLDLDALEAKVAAMTRGEWEAGRNGDNGRTYYVWVTNPKGRLEPSCQISTRVLGKVNAEGIAALRNAAPALIAQARRAEAAERERDEAWAKIKKVADAMEPFLLEMARDGKTGITATEAVPMLVADRKMWRGFQAASARGTARLSKRFKAAEAEAARLRGIESAAKRWRDEGIHRICGCQTCRALVDALPASAPGGEEGRS